MHMNYIVYCYCNKINLKKYIGITKRSLEQREKNHLSEAYNPMCLKYNTPFKSAIRKYGIDAFDKIIIDYADSLEEANEKEKYYIQKYNSYCYKKDGWGYNATEGGDGVKRHYKSIVQLDKNDGSFINVFESISDVEKVFNTGHISECVNKKIPTVCGYCWMFEDEYKSLTKKEVYDYVQIINNRIVQLSEDNQIVKIWDSALEASKTLGCHDSLIIKNCHGMRKTHNGFVWRFYSDYINNIIPTPKVSKIFKYKNDYLLESYKTLNEAGIKNNIIPQVLGRHINTGKEYKGYYWYKKECDLI